MEPNRDRWGRYLLPHPETGQEQGWTRVTTLAAALDDETNITKWKLRNAIKGVGLRPDLLALAQAHTLDDKQVLNKAAEQAMDAAQANVRSNLGTALHRFAERVDAGEKFPVPQAHQADISAYQILKQAARIETRADFMERITVVPEIGVAGTIDRIGRRDGVIHIIDLKTGENLDFGWVKMAIQLATYSRGKGLWNMETSTWEPMPPVDQNRGIIIHLPAGKGKAEAHWVNLNAGWQLAQLAYQVREERKRKDLHEPIDLGPVA